MWPWMRFTGKCLLFVGVVFVAIWLFDHCHHYGHERSMLLGLAMLGLATATMTLCIALGTAVADRRGAAWGAGIGAVLAAVGCVVWASTQPPGGSPGHSFAEEFRVFLILSIPVWLLMLWMVFRVSIRTGREPEARTRLRSTARWSLLPLVLAAPVMASAPAIYHWARQGRVQDLFLQCHITAIALVLLTALPWILLDRGRVRGPAQKPHGWLDNCVKIMLLAIIPVEAFAMIAALNLPKYMSQLTILIHLAAVVFLLIALAVQAYRNRWHRWLSIFVSVLLYAATLWWFYGVDF